MYLFSRKICLKNNVQVLHTRQCRWISSCKYCSLTISFSARPVSEWSKNCIWVLRDGAHAQNLTFRRKSRLFFNTCSLKWYLSLLSIEIYCTMHMHTLLQFPLRISSCFHQWYFPAKFAIFRRPIQCYCTLLIWAWSVSNIKTHIGHTHT